MKDIEIGIESNLLSTLPARARDYRYAKAIALVSVLFFAVTAPFAGVPLAKIWAFIPIYQTAQVINDLVTAILLYGQFSILRSRALLVLASGYLFIACIAVAHTLSFPGLFAPSGWLGAGVQTTAWLYMIWHGAFPLCVIAYARLKGARHDSSTSTGPAHRMIACAAIVVLVIACASIALATYGEHILPVIMAGNVYTRGMLIVVGSVWISSMLALVALRRCRPYSVLDVWLQVVLLVWCFDVALSALLNTGRFDLGFYAGRTYGLLATSVVLLLLLIENSRLYAQLGTAQATLTSQYRALQQEVQMRIEAEAALMQANAVLEQRVRERTASLQDALKELESFSYSVSHDLKAPLRAVLGMTKILNEDHGAALGHDARKLIDIAHENAQRMRQLIDELLSFSHLARKPIVPQMIDTRAMIEKVLVQLLPHQDHAITWRLHAVPFSYGTPSLVRQVWENLLSNAIKFSARQTRAEIEVGGHEEEGESIFFIKDNGAGFDMAHYDKLFMLFQRLHSQEQFAGTGVGLAIVQRIVTRHGGRIWARSELGQGATFYFSLPRATRDE